MICAGIDAGSRLLKIVLMDARAHRVIASGAMDQGVHHDELASSLFNRLLAEAGCSRRKVVRIVATGHARNAITLADATVTEITCHACGVHHLLPHARTVVEIGGQDSKLLCLKEDGTVYDFTMNDRCAAGTGRFLEMVAERLDIKLEKLGALARRSKKPAAISSMCTVFAETEIIGLLAGGAGPEDIVAGVQRSLALRIAAMAGRKIALPVVLTGGVALVSGMDDALALALGHPVSIVPQPQFTGALGAAILAARQLRSEKRHPSERRKSR